MKKFGIIEKNRGYRRQSRIERNNPEEAKKLKDKKTEKGTIGEDNLIEGILYLLSKPVSLKKLSSIAQIELMKVEEVMTGLQKKYGQMNTPFIIEFTINEFPEKNEVELKLPEKVLKTLASYDFITAQELPSKYYRYMSTIMLLEYVKNKRIDKKLLEKEFKMDKYVLEKNIRVLMQYGYLEKTQNYYTTSERFLIRMGLPSDKDLVTKALKEKTIEYALELYGFEND